MFNLVDQHDIVFGTDSPNDVTQQEFDELAELYSNIREGNSHIRFENRSRTGADTFVDNPMSAAAFSAFREGAMDDMARILQTPEGRTVLRSLSAGGKTRTSDFTIGNVSNPSRAATEREQTDANGDGTGAGARVFYRPGHEQTSHYSSGLLTATSDTILFHELVHAHHSGQGTARPSDDTIGLLEAIENDAAADAGVTREEYATVGLGAFAGSAISENAYRASHRTLAGANAALADKYKRRSTYR
jgi:hypothetical protein